MNAQNDPNWLTTPEFFLALMVLAFGGLVLLLYTLISVRLGHSNSPDFRRYFVVIVLVMGTLFLIVTGLSDKQIAPAIGFFGTVVGYILGRGAAQAEPVRNPDERQ